MTTVEDLAELVAAGHTVAQIQAAARHAMAMHVPDRATVHWTRRWRVLPVPARQRAHCLRCQAAYPCPTARYATRLLSAGRLALARVIAPGT